MRFPVLKGAHYPLPAAELHNRGADCRWRGRSSLRQPSGRKAGVLS
ncbi:hypothetical protein HMPREF9080_02476 [Cardiobacterium valvarum F0432]|uniref:Uncharacterized protein n=1 Tax=Cardiobacterium valvarum F0432 TaxID=797473 RepID=G9ZI65_9GAMM|nr:hypothetical protein HMPREF9080_02476 [Cardiobacterium valvarum F0432]